jgi:hypothetical protein
VGRSPEDIDAYGYLQGVYQGRWPYEPHRVRAARECLPFERPKLAVTAIMNDDGSFAAKLERAIGRSSSPKVIEATAVPMSSEPPSDDGQAQPSDVKVLGPVLDRRFRR